MKNKTLFLDVFEKSMEAEKMPAVVSKRGVDDGNSLQPAKEDYNYYSIIDSSLRNCYSFSELIRGEKWE